MTERGALESFWDDEAKGYDAAHDRCGDGGNPLWTRMELVLRLLGSSPGAVLDCGMGPGRLLVELERRGWSVAGIDVSGEMVALARERLPAAPDRLLRGTIESLPFAAGSFDAVVATGVFEYVDDLPRAVAEVARVLRAGGLLVASMPNPYAPHTVWRQRVVYPAVRRLRRRVRLGRRPVPLRRPGLLSRGRLEALLDAGGLAVEQVEYVRVERTRRGRASPPPAAQTASGPGDLGEAVRRLLRSQFVVAARKAGAAPDRLGAEASPSAP